MSVGHVLDHMPDHVLDHIVIALVTIALQVKWIVLMTDQTYKSQICKDNSEFW